MPAKKQQKKRQPPQKAHSPPPTSHQDDSGGDTLMELVVSYPSQQASPARGRGRSRGSRLGARVPSRSQKRQRQDTETEEIVEQEPVQDPVKEQKTPDTEQSATATASPIVRRRAKAEPVNMTKEQEDDFSEWLQKNPHHYDMSDSNFRMKERKTRELETKAVEYGMTCTQLVTRLKTIRDIVIKDRRKGKSGDGAKAVSKRTQRVLNLFGFLAEYYHARPSRDTLKNVYMFHVNCEAAQRETAARDAGSSDETDEEDIPQQDDDTPHPEAAAKGAKPKRSWKKTSKAAEQQKEILDALQKAMAQNTAVQAQIQQSYGGGPTMDRERRTFGEWFAAALPRIDDSLWVEFRSKVTTTVDTYHERSIMLSKVGDQQQPQAQSGYQYPHIAQTISSPSQPHQFSFMRQQQQPARTYTPLQSVTYQTSPGMPDWLRKFQSPGQDRIFPEHMTLFSPQQLSQLEPPVRMTSQFSMSPVCSAGASVRSVRTSSAPSAASAIDTTVVCTQNAISAHSYSAAQGGIKPPGASAPIFTCQSSDIYSTPMNTQQFVGTAQSGDSLNQSANKSGFDMEMGDLFPKTN